MVTFPIMDKLPLTSNQRQVLSFIIRTKAQKGHTPSLQEIQAHFGFKAIGTVQDYLTVLQKKGYVRRSSKARDIEVLDNAGIEIPDRDTVRLPIVGQVAAGSPILAEKTGKDICMWTGRSPVEDAFLLRVRGKSMIQGTHYERRHGCCCAQRTCENGEIAVCLIDGRPRSSASICGKITLS